MLKQAVKKAVSRIIPHGVLEKLREWRLDRKRDAFYNIGRYSYALSPELIKSDTIIRDFVSIAAGAQLGPGNHPISFMTLSPFSYHFVPEANANIKMKAAADAATNSHPVIIGNDVWIGTNAVIMGGIEIGEGSVIGANAVVTHNVAPYSVVGGVPARMIRKRFDEDTERKLCALKWPCLPDAMLWDLPFENVNESIRILEERIEKKRNSIASCFIISSCIYSYNKPLNFSDTRSIFSVETRIAQTRETIESIRKYCPSAYIVLADNGEQNPEESVKHCVDRFLYLGGNKKIYKSAAAKNKSIGETTLLLASLSEDMKDYDLIFKISGRYRLTDKFDIANFDTDAFNFKNYFSGKVVTGIGKYKEGSHSTRLYAFPGKYLEKYRKGLKTSYILCLTGKSIEFSLPWALRHEKFFYHRQIGLSGEVAVDGCQINE